MRVFFLFVFTAASKSPVFTLFSQTIDGLSTIRPLQLEGVLEAAVIRDIDANTAAYLAWAHVNRWLGVYICITAVLYAVYALYALYAT